MGVSLFTDGDIAEATVLAIFVKADAILSTLLSVFFLALFLASDLPRLDHAGALPYFGAFQHPVPPPTVCTVFW